MNVDRLLQYSYNPWDNRSLSDILTYAVYVPVLTSDFWVDVPVILRYDIQEADKRKLGSMAWIVP